MLSDFWNFLVAVFWTWQRWLGGSGGGGALVVLVYLYERFTGTTVSKRVYVAVFIIGFLFLAFFMAWRDQYQLANEARNRAQVAEARVNETKPPNLITEIRKVIVAPANAGKDAIMTVEATIKNDGSPSNMDHHRLVGFTADGRTIEPVWLPLPRNTLTLLNDDRHGSDVLFYTRDALINKTFEQAIPTGAGTSGWFQVLIPGVPRDHIGEVKFLWTFVDIKNRQYEVRFYAGSRLAVPNVNDLQRSLKR